MDYLQDFNYVLTHWSFGVTILIGLITSEYSSAEAVASIFLSGASTILSAICGSTMHNEEEQFRRKRLSDVVYFLISWLDILTNLVAAATCARLASATVDYISKGHFREFLFGLEQHSLGEPWPDVLGVTIIVVVSILFMMGLEKSSMISFLLLAALLCNFAFFTVIGSFHTVIKFPKLWENFKIHSFKRMLRSAAECTFAYTPSIPKVQKNSCLKISLTVLCPLLLYVITAIVFSLMIHHREMVGTAIPLVQVFEKRDVDWARPVIATFTICVVCLVLTEVLPLIFNAFVKLAGKEWRVFVPLIQYRSSMSGAPILAIFAAGSLAAILAFACPLSHLIKLLNTSTLVKCILVSCQLVYNRYKPEMNYDWLVHDTNVHYSKLNKGTARTSVPQSFHQSLRDKVRAFFASKPQYIHQLSSPRSLTRKLVCPKENKMEERECLLLDDYSNKSINVNLADDSESENGEGELVFCSEEESASDTDIDLIVEEYKEGLKIATVGKFSEAKPSTRITSTIVIMCLITTVIASITLSLCVLKIIRVPWPSIIGIVISIIIVTSMPQNSADKSKENILPSILFPFCHIVSIMVNVLLSSTIILDIWEGIVFWSLAGLLLFWRCDCCTCDGLFRSSKVDPRKISCTSATPAFAYRENLVVDTVHIR